MAIVRLLQAASRSFGSARACSSFYTPIKRPNNKDITGEVKRSPADQKQTQSQFIEALQAHIKIAGPTNVADYMRRVLTNPAAGYYMNQDVFGSKGDYITSPEINQIFGELISIWALTEWRKVGSPTPLQLVELGPGRGTMIQDILRVLTKFEIQQNMSVHLVEVSPYLAKAQAGRLCYQQSEHSDGAEKFYMQGETISGIPIYWYHRLEDVPQEFSIILAHEFYDAMPIHKLQKMDNTWKEILIDNLPEVNTAGEQFRYVVSQNETAMSKLAKDLISSDEQRDHIEYSTEQQVISSDIAQRLESYGGIALIMDYGHEGEKGDTFRSFKNHELHSPLKDPGTADLTADVDFAQLKRHFKADDKCITFGPVTQQRFIKEMGGDTRIKVSHKRTCCK